MYSTPDQNKKLKVDVYSNKKFYRDLKISTKTGSPSVKNFFSKDLEVTS